MGRKTYIAAMWCRWSAVVPPLVLVALTGVMLTTSVLVLFRRRRARAAAAAADLEASIARLVAEQEAAEHRQSVLDTLAVGLDDVETELAIVRLVREALLDLDPHRPYEFHLVDRFDPELVLRFATGSTPPDAPERTSPWTAFASTAGGPIIYTTTDVDDLCPHLASRLIEHCSAVCVPLLSMGRFGGVLYATGPEGEPPPAYLVETYEAIAALAGAALATVRAFGTTARTQALPAASSSAAPFTEIDDDVDMEELDDLDDLDGLDDHDDLDDTGLGFETYGGFDRPGRRAQMPPATGPVITTRARVRPTSPMTETVIVDVRDLDDHRATARPHRSAPDALSADELQVITGLKGLDAAIDAIDLAGAARVPYAVMDLEIDHCDSYRGWHGEAVHHQALRLLIDSALLGIHRDATLFAVDTGRFVAVLPRISAHNALTIAGRIREDIARACRNGRTPTFTVCFGIVQGHPGTTTEDLLDAADDALRDAQSRGIDRAVVNVGLHGGAAASTVRGAAL